MATSEDSQSRSEISTIDVDENSRRRSRSPFHYPVETHFSSSIQNLSDSATYSRYKYYSRLHDPSLSELSIPDHVIPPSFFLPLAPFVTHAGKQSSVISVFAMWNCMVGTSLLSMPWAINQAGLVGGIVCLIAMAFICCYTAYRIVNLQSQSDVEGSEVEFSDLCRHLLGRWAEWLSIGTSLLVLLGGAVVYWVLMSNFLYHTVLQLYESSHAYHKLHNVTDSHHHSHDVVCMLPLKNNTNITLMDVWISPPNAANATQLETPLFQRIWNIYTTVPFFLIILTAPIINFKSPTFFTKFNALGTLSVMYLIVFICLKAWDWGLNISFSAPNITTHVPYFRWSFTVLTGILSLAYFIHNCVISIVRNQRYPEHKSRNVVIAFVLVASTYLLIGVIFYVTFPLSKDCIEDNLLNNFSGSDTLAFVSRLFLLFQMLTVFPLLLYIFRAHFFYTFYGAVYPSFKHVVILNVVLVSICIVFAVFLPQIGTIIRFVGSFCGFIYIFALPNVTYIASLQARTIHAPITTVLHSILVVFGFANLVSQFIV